LRKKERAAASKRNRDVSARDALYKRRRIFSMSFTVPGEAKPDNLMAGKAWKCAVCGYIFQGEIPLAECPQCAGTGREFVEFTEKDWDDVMNINIRTLFFLSQAVTKIFIKQGRGGKIINTASTLSFQGGILVPSYTASKSAVAGLTRLMANELARHNINVNAIAPGYMATDNTASIRQDAVRSKAILDRIPAGRWGSPDDLKGVVVFLASEASSYLCGSIISVDGGWLTR
jgi:NAD(P)-dependent dehydrogenase (short-subunit alcohol dehydrogenase family)